MENDGGQKRKYSVPQEDLSKKSVVQLKELLKEKGLPLSGNKATLILRLESGGKMGKTSDKKRKRSSPSSLFVNDNDIPKGLKLNEVKRKLASFVKSVASLVDFDWHDGYEEQGEEINTYFDYVRKISSLVINLGIISGNSILHCHNVIVAIADSWDNMNSIPMRGGIEISSSISLQIGKLHSQEFYDMSPLLHFLWGFLLRRAANDSSQIEDVELDRMLKDSEDYIGSSNENDEISFLDKVLHGVWDDDSEIESSEIAWRAAIKKGDHPLKLALKRDRSRLTSFKKTYKMRRAIDRRFDGPKHLRTRGYDSSDDEGDCQIM